MSLFDQLRRLYRRDKFQLEDFHTEIVAQVLRNSRALTLAWLQGIKATTLRNVECLLGYWLPTDDPAGAVCVGANLGASPKSRIGKRAISAFRTFSKKSNRSWEPEGLSEDSVWGAISKCRSLQKFMSESDHIKAIKAYLLGVLKEVESIKRAHPDLPWKAQNAGSDEDAG